MLLASLIEKLRPRRASRSRLAGRGDALVDRQSWFLDLQVCPLEERRVLSAAGVGSSGSGSGGAGVSGTAPVANNDTYSVAQNTLLKVDPTIGLLINDTGTGLSAKAVSGPTNGQLNLLPDGGFGYQPNSGFVGTDTFTYQDNSAAGPSNVATVTINVEPLITGTMAGQTTNDATAIAPFANVAISNGTNSAELITAQISLDDPAKGTLVASGGFVETSPGSQVLQLTANAATLTTAIDGLMFQPTPHRVAPGGTETTVLSITLTDSDLLAPVVDSNTSVVTTALNEPPVVTVVSNQTVDVGQSLTLVSATFVDPNPQDTHTATINWGDGTITPGVVTETDSQGSISGSHVYFAGGSYNTTVTVTDNHQASGSASFGVTVNDVAPTIQPVAQQSTVEGATLVVSNISFTEPDPQGSYSATIDWGDGNQSNATVSISQTAAGTTGAVSASHVYAAAGNYTATVTLVYTPPLEAVSDAAVAQPAGSTLTGVGSLSSSQSFSVLVAAGQPSFTTPLGSFTIDQGQTLTLPTIGFSDPTFANPAQSYTPSFTYSVDWGDGSAATTGVATILQSAVTPSTGQFSASHVYLVPGVQTANVTLTDNEGHTVSQSFNVDVVSVPPTILPIGPQSVVEGSTLTIDNIQFSDPGTQGSYTATVDWGDGNQSDATVSVTETSSGTTGTISGSHVYAEAGNYSATVTLIFDPDSPTVGDASVGLVAVSAVSGGTSLTTSQAFSVNVTAGQPSFLTSLDDVVLNPGQTLLLPTIGFTDPTFANPAAGYTPSFTYSINWGDGSPASTGAASVLQSASSPTTGQFSGSHLYTAFGPHQVTVTLTDSEGHTVSQSFTATLADGSPTILPIAPQSTVEGATLTVNNILFSDPDNQGSFTATVDWGDGTQSNGTVVVSQTATGTTGSVTASHAYAEAGNYMATITITHDTDVGGAVVGSAILSAIPAGSSGSDILTSSQSFSVAVAAGHPSFTTQLADTSLNQGQTLSLAAIGFSDPTFANPAQGYTPSFTYSINWGDGSPLTAGAATVLQSATSPTTGQFSASHLYSVFGAHLASITLTDNEGHTASESFTVKVLDVPPTLNAIANQSANEGSQFNLSGVTFSDPGTQEQYTATVSWGDGLQSTANVVANSNGNGTAGVLTASHVFATPGQYQATVTLADGNGGVTSQSFTVAVADVAPTFTTHLANTSLLQGQTLTLPTVAFSDPTFANPAQGYSPAFTYSIDWGDGSSATTGSASVVQSVSSPTAGQLGGSHLYTVFGTHQVTIMVNDGEGLSTSESFKVFVADVAPTVGPITNQAVNEGAALSLSGITFSDPGTQENYTATIQWGDGTSSIGSLLVDQTATGTTGFLSASHMYATVGSYNPVVAISDGNGGIGRQSFTVAVADVAPKITTNLDDVSLKEGQTLSLPMIGFSDPTFANSAQGYTPSFTYSINWGDGSAVQSGAATVLQSANTPTTGQFSGSHRFSVPGTYTATVALNDNEGATTSESFQIVVVNVPPSIGPIATQTANEGSNLELSGITFTDPGTEETFTASINWGDGSPLTAGTVTDQVSVNGAAGSVAATHIFADAGTYQGTVTVTDSYGGATTRAFTVSIMDVAPSVIAPPQSVNEGSGYVVQFSDPGFNNPLNPGGPITQSFTYNVNWGDGSVLTGAQANVDQLGGPGVPTLGSVAHIYGVSGTFQATLTIFDRHGEAGVLNFTVQVRDVPPTVNPYTAAPIDVAQLVTLSGLTFSDPTFAVPALNYVPSFTYSINWGDGLPASVGTTAITQSGSPGVLTLGSFGGTHVYGEPGTYTITATVFDPTGASGKISFQQVITNVPPQFTTTITLPSINEGSYTTTSSIGFSSPTFAVPTLNYTPTFTYQINWGDGTPLQTGSVPVTHPGAYQDPTQGAIQLTHQYGYTGQFTGAITIFDTHGGQVTQTFTAIAFDVTPLLTGLSTTNLTPYGTVSTVGQAYDPGTNPLTVTVHWGDGTSSVYTVPGAKLDSINLTHQYLGPPDPLDPAASIPVTVTISQHVGSAVQQLFLVQIPGTGLVYLVTFLPEPKAPPLPAPLTVLTEGSSFNVANNIPTIATNDTLAPRGDQRGAAEDHVILRVVNPAGKEGDNVLLPNDVLEDLPGYLKRLPDGHYRVYFQQGDTQRERQIMDVDVRQGRPVDAGGESGGTQDRPPSAQYVPQPPSLDPAALPVGIAGEDTSLQDTSLQDTALQDTALQDIALQDIAAQDLAPAANAANGATGNPTPNDNEPADLELRSSRLQTGEMTDGAGPLDDLPPQSRIPDFSSTGAPLAITALVWAGLQSSNANGSTGKAATQLAAGALSKPARLVRRLQQAARNRHVPPTI